MKNLISLRFAKISFVTHYLASSSIAKAILLAGPIPSLLIILPATFFGLPVIEYPQFVFFDFSNPASLLAFSTEVVIPLNNLSRASETLIILVPLEAHFRLRKIN